jgi:hypothetical protein
LTVSEIGVVCVADAPVPVTVTVVVPAGVEADVVIVNVELCPDAIEAGLNDADAPAGRPDADNATFCAAPLVTVVLIVLDAGCPAVTDTELGAAAIEKSFDGGAPPAALNSATPLDQYIADGKVPPNVWALGAPSGL